MSAKILYAQSLSECQKANQASSSRPPGRRHLVPLKDRVVLKPLTAVGKIGSLFLPENRNSKLKQHIRAEVVAVGPSKDEEYERVLKPGDRVIVSELGGDEVEVNEGEKLIVIRERDITAVIESGDVALSSEETRAPWDVEAEEEERQIAELGTRDAHPEEVHE